MSTKHTSGLWSKSGHGEEIVIDCGNIYGAATLPVHDPEFPAGEQHANARLMVAAPDLLAACREFVRFADLPDQSVPRGGYIRYQVKAIGGAREAIAKATGEEDASGKITL